MSYETIVMIISVAISMFSIGLSIMTKFKEKCDNSLKFIEMGDSEEQKRYRKMVYDVYNRYESVSIDSEVKNEIIKKELIVIGDEISKIISFYEFWAIMLFKKYIPIWLFADNIGFATIKIYLKVKPYIEYRRKSQKNYAMNFEKMINKIEREHKVKDKYLNQI